MTRESTHGRNARQAVRHHLSGVLSTHSSKFPGYPYGSAIPHMTDARGCPVILISHLAEHTHNIEADDRVSFLVSESGATLQSFGRASLLGRAYAVDDAQVADRYLRLHPDGERSLAIGGFRFFRIVPEHVRFIEGFGGIHWLSGGSYMAPEVALTVAESEIIAHMNQDHVSTMQTYCRYLHNIDPHSVRMIGIDQDGFALRADDAVVRFDFEHPVTTPVEARGALVALAQLSRS